MKVKIILLNKSCIFWIKKAIRRNYSWMVHLSGPNFKLEALKEPIRIFLLFAVYVSYVINLIKAFGYDMQGASEAPCMS